MDFRVVDDDRVFLRAEFRRIVEEDAVDLLLRILELAAVEQEAADMDGEGPRDVQETVAVVGIEQKDGKSCTPEQALAAAKRELREETGYESDSWSHLLTVPSQATLSDNLAWIFRAENCRPAAAQRLDDMELLDVQKHSPAEIEEMIFSGRFQQAVHITAWLLAARKA